MEIRKKINLWIIPFTLITILTGCSLEPELTDSYDDSVAWSNEKNLELYLNGFYPLVGQSYYSGAVADDCYADLLKMNTPSDNINLLVTGSTLISSGSNPLGSWEWAYTWTRTCNEFLDGLKKYGGNLSAGTTLRAEAEVRFFRAWVSFSLAQKYGSFIIYKELPTGKERALNTPEECWDFIEEDLDFAAANLPETVPPEKKGKLTKGAALAFKSRCMLYAQRWAKASEAAGEVMGLGLYDLHPDYADLFTFRRTDGRTTKESILEFGFISPDFGYSFDYFYCPPGDKGYSQVSPTEELVSSYQMADGSEFSWENPEQAKNPYEGREKRFYASILYNGAPWKGRTVETFVGGADGYAVGGGTTCTGYYMRKLFDETRKTQEVGFEPGELTYYAIRYAEVLLIYAEAMAEQGNLKEALSALNQVRSRAGFTKEVTASGKSEFMSLLRHERKIELAFEGHRYWDLRRWKLSSSVLNNMNCHGIKITRNEDGSFSYEKVDCDGGKTRIFPEKYYRFPIPLAEIQRNPLCQQFEEWK
ncbi:RagB/SusD family nutrient uptake outer membrane protein [Parabacteroides pacaensis]|uniref:RagB/SusD family nutrient uptake outer membrane protein n=1 Tax=Parabacteroides pacaensis TaxID=2086575 RepID=UPI000D0EAAE0|nr:RagB/SusD family nutrient uptake outer membrane protein [Parabacteroides pacaensis]